MGSTRLPSTSGTSLSASRSCGAVDRVSDRGHLYVGLRRKVSCSHKVEQVSVCLALVQPSPTRVMWNLQSLLMSRQFALTCITC